MKRKETIQSGVIPYRMKKGRMEVLLITASRGKKFIFPKGYVGRGLSLTKSAEREAWEEAGAKGKITTGVLGAYRYQKNRKHFRVKIYPMRVSRVLSKRDWIESDHRAREWMTISTATEYIYYEELAEMLCRLKSFLRKNS